MRQREQRVCAMPSLVDAVVAEAPGSLVAKVAPPVAGVGKRKTDVAEHPGS